jgi:hypothetical protein
MKTRSWSIVAALILALQGHFMDFNDYQQKSRATAQYPAIGHPVIYPTLGLVNEAGEVRKISWKW